MHPCLQHARARLIAGFDRMIGIFDISCPGRQVEDRPACFKDRVKRQPGIYAMSSTDLCMQLDPTRDLASRSHKLTLCYAVHASVSFFDAFSDLL